MFTLLALSAEKQLSEAESTNHKRDFSRSTNESGFKRKIVIASLLRHRDVKLVKRRAGKIHDEDISPYDANAKGR